MKKLLVILLAAIMVFSIAACSNQDKDKDTDDDKYKEITVIITEETFGTDTFHFETVDSETVEITKFTTTLDRAHEVKIPAYLDGKRVVSIGKEAFCYSSSIQTITFPTEAEYLAGDAEFDMSKHSFVIADYAFRDCVALQTLAFPSYVTEIGVGAFFGCSSLTSLTFAADGVLAEIKDYAFMECIGLVGVELPASVKTIGVAAFYGCEALESVKINEGTEMILKQAFQNCSAMASVELPASLLTVGKFAFHGSDALYIGGLTYAGNSAEVESYIKSLMLEEAPDVSVDDPEA